MGPVLMAIINQSPQFVRQCIYTAGEWPETRALSCRQEGAHALSHVPVLTCTRSPALTRLRFSPGRRHFPGHLSTSLCAHTDLLVTWKSKGELSLLIQILSAHIVTQAKHGLNSTGIRGQSKAAQLITCLYDCPEQGVVSVPAGTCAASLHTSFELEELLRDLAWVTLCADHLGHIHTDAHFFLHIHAPTCTLLQACHQLHYHH